MRRKEILIPLFCFYLVPKGKLTHRITHAIVEKHAVILANGFFPCSLKKHNNQIVTLTLLIGTAFTRLLHSRGVNMNKNK